MSARADIAPTVLRAPDALALLAAACVALAAAIWFAAFHTGAGAQLDADLLSQFTGRYSEFNAIASTLAVFADPLPFAALTLAVGALAVARGLRTDALIAVATPVLAAATTQVLKPLLAEPRDVTLHPRPQSILVTDASWPSGHSTAAASLALALILVSPPQHRTRIASAALAFALAVGCSMMVLGWHYPSDVFGGFAVAGAWMLAALALSRRSSR